MKLNSNRKTIKKLIEARDSAIREALVNLGRYKFDRFGYFAARYVVLNGLLHGSDVAHRKNNPFKALVDHARRLVDELDERDLQNRLDEDEIRTERMIDDNGQLYWHNE
tara:strand:- start:114 stop:440 length:327 start_codon:yes stop_codon:yes gene_type:complete